MDVDLTCPSCRHVDQVQSVPAICSGGSSTGTVYSTHTGVGFTGNSIIPVLTNSATTHTRTTALARSLARDPGLLSTGRRTFWAIVLLIPAALVTVIAALDLGEDGPEPIIGRVIAAVFFVGALSVPSMIIILSISVTRRRNRTVRAGVAAADRLWRSAFYCHRCGSVFWPTPPSPTVAARVSVSPANFRWTVWSAGGYARL
ncbi:hypothetical protein [Nocardia thailandica]|uniref:hypothetical protein n=1 Tax=Nocardia thailandica TaxID=257275 RepID=UPI0002E25BD4|nr:hypothetical protein [Nocardia thailandica]